ncbi:alpha/beta-hydrolase family protein [Rhabdothermincola sediminis]|uniref:alpha/beta-hydrolase family protein n=1 Tax=Rhabdothermincola sediminis TaxID=2751370 RepID=UPI001AA0AC96|nr:alpha/beta-hydrolase family protein [Rhabdothermincola sediminis]
MAFDPADEWFRRPDVWSGVVLGAWVAAESFGPSLMPRTTLDQALVSGASAATGFAVGNATYGLIGREVEVRDQPLAFGAALAAALTAKLVLADAAARSLPAATLRAMAGGLAGGSAACGAVALVRNAERPGVTAGVLASIGAAAGSVVLFRSIRDQVARRDDIDPPPPRPLPAVAQSATVAALLAAVVNGYRKSGQAMTRVLRRRIGLSPGISEVGGRTAATMAWAAVITAFADTFVRGMELYDRVMDPGYDTPPDTPACSAGPGSAVSFSRTGRQGRRFLLNRPSADDIHSVMGTPARAEPVRVFVGYDAARTPEDRVALALRELERAGAFDRSILVVGCPAGTGYVNTVPFEAVDHLALGDAAGVAVQYERLPSLLALHRTGVGGEHVRLLLAGIRDALAERPPSCRPRVVLYGESLGAWAGQNAFLHRGLRGLDELGVQRALFVGTPYYSGWLHEVLGGRDVTPGSVLEVPSALPLRSLSPAQRAALRVVLLTHHNDPVRKINLGLLVQRPDWLSHQRPPTVPARQRFRPMITGFQTIVDTANATHQVPGVFRATGHDYRLDVPAVVREVFELPSPTPGQWERLMTKLQDEEAARAARFQLPRKEDGADVERRVSGTRDPAGSPSTARRRWRSPRLGAGPGRARR